MIGENCFSGGMDADKTHLIKVSMGKGFKVTAHTKGSIREVSVHYHIEIKIYFINCIYLLGACRMDIEMTNLREAGIGKRFEVTDTEGKHYGASTLSC